MDRLPKVAPPSSPPAPVHPTDPWCRPGQCRRPCCRHRLRARKAVFGGSGRGRLNAWGGGAGGSGGPPQRGQVRSVQPHHRLQHGHRVRLPRRHPRQVGRGRPRPHFLAPPHQAAPGGSGSGRSGLPAGTMSPGRRAASGGRACRRAAWRAAGSGGGDRAWPGRPGR